MCRLDTPRGSTPRRKEHDFSKDITSSDYALSCLHITDAHLKSSKTITKEIQSES